MVAIEQTTVKGHHHGEQHRLWRNSTYLSR